MRSKVRGSFSAFVSFLTACAFGFSFIFPIYVGEINLDGMETITFSLNGWSIKLQQCEGDAAVCKALSTLDFSLTGIEGSSFNGVQEGDASSSGSYSFSGSSSLPSCEMYNVQHYNRIAILSACGLGFFMLLMTGLFLCRKCAALGCLKFGLLLPLFPAGGALGMIMYMYDIECEDNYSLANASSVTGGIISFQLGHMFYIISGASTVQLINFFTSCCCIHREPDMIVLGAYGEVTHLNANQAHDARDYAANNNYAPAGGYVAGAQFKDKEKGLSVV